MTLCIALQQQVQPPVSPPRQLRTVEEDRFSLRPIGPGVTPLEPEGGVSTGTLNRATTPSFPVSPVASAGTSTKPQKNELSCDVWLSNFAILASAVYLPYNGVMSWELKKKLWVLYSPLLIFRL